MIEPRYAFSNERIYGESELPPYMEWIKPRFSYGQVDKAGDLLRHLTISEAPSDQLEIIDNWRAAHYFPLNAFQTVLRRRAKKVDPKAIVVQRIKRLSSIQAKLKRFPDMQLSRMQDIGGCRAVVRTANQVGQLGLIYGKSKRAKHRLVGIKDYITQPKNSGYRGVHLVYRYQGAPSSAFNGFRVEIQLRSTVQHSWATAVEIAGTFIKQALKSSQGADEWLRFFALAGSRFAMLEGTPLVPDTPANPDELTKELSEYAERLRVEEFLIGCQIGINVPLKWKIKPAYFLLELDPIEKSTSTTAFPHAALDLAFQRYFEAEKKIGVNAVLVSAQSVNELKRAYPNYYIDSVVFLAFLNRVLGRKGLIDDLYEPKKRDVSN